MYIMDILCILTTMIYFIIVDVEIKMICVTKVAIIIEKLEDEVKC